MIQLNLLPDVKLQYIRARRTRRNINAIAIIITLISFGLFMLMFLSANVFQPIHKSNLNEDIAKYTDELKSIKDLDKVLTIQNQLNSVNNLHTTKPVITRLPGYLNQITPNNVTISSLSADLTQYSVNISGSADSLATVNKFVDTLKFTEYTTNTNNTPQKAFSDVVLSSFGKSDRGAAYSITFKYDPTIFSDTQQITLIVPNTITTRSTTEKPTELFQPKPKEKDEQ